MSFHFSTPRGESSQKQKGPLIFNFQFVPCSLLRIIIINFFVGYGTNLQLYVHMTREKDWDMACSLTVDYFVPYAGKRDVSKSEMEMCWNWGM